MATIINHTIFLLLKCLIVKIKAILNSSNSFCRTGISFKSLMLLLHVCSLKVSCVEQTTLKSISELKQRSHLLL